MGKKKLYNELVWCYEAISDSEEYRAEAKFVKKIVRKYKRVKGNKLLDVGCGHGWHDRFLKKDFKITGVDLNEGVLKLAKKRNPEAVYQQGDMRKFDLKEKFEVVISFDAMMYNLNHKELEKALENMARHLAEGGVLIFHLDPHIKGKFKPGSYDVCQGRKGNKLVTLMVMEHDKNPKDGVAEQVMVFLIGEKGKELKIRVTKGKAGIFEMAKIKRILKEWEFKVELYDGDFSGKRYSKKSKFPIFVCVKK